MWGREDPRAAWAVKGEEGNRVKGQTGSHGKGLYRLFIVRKFKYKHSSGDLFEQFGL